MGIKRIMTGSPYQVETIRRKQAIEHENDGYMPMKKQLPNCQHRIKGNGFVCGLFNSGCKTCLPFRCAYLNAEIRRNLSCDTCVYYFDTCCLKADQSISLEAATYCCYYKDQNSHKESLSRAMLIIPKLSNEILKLKRQIHRMELKIKQLQSKHGSNTPVTDKLLIEKQKEYAGAIRKLAILEEEKEHSQKILSAHSKTNGRMKRHKR